MLEIKDLHAGFEDNEILKGTSLHVKKGEIHSIMGPNGSGKSSLIKALAGYPSYDITSGSATVDGKNLLDLEPEERALAGLFVGFQNPVEVPGVNNAEFLRMAYNAKLAHAGEEEVDPLDFEDILAEKMSLLKMDQKFNDRFVNDRFSGGEKKKNEILQMALLNPKVALLDEIDSGLDVDALKIVAESVMSLQTGDNALVVVTHYKRLLDYIKPDFVHIFNDGQIVKTGGIELVGELEKHGYERLAANAA